MRLTSRIVRVRRKQPTMDTLAMMRGSSPSHPASDPTRGMTFEVAKARAVRVHSNGLYRSILDSEDHHYRIWKKVAGQEKYRLLLTTRDSAQAFNFFLRSAEENG